MCGSRWLFRQVSLNLETKTASGRFNANRTTQQPKDGGDIYLMRLSMSLCVTLSVCVSVSLGLTVNRAE